MAETPEPGTLDDPFAPGSLLEQRLRVLESAWAQPQPGQPGAVPGMAGYPSRLESLAAELAAQKTQMRDLEKALVERIADVDDDRRLTGTQLQRGWQAQRDEFEGRLRRFGGRAALALGLTLALVGGGLLGLYAQVRSTQAAQTGQIETLRQELHRLSDLSTVKQPDTQVENKLASLSAAVDRISSALGEISGGQRQTPPPQGTNTPSPLAGEIARLAAGEERLTVELESLKHSLETLLSNLPRPTTRAGEAPTPDANAGPPLPVPAPAADIAPAAPQDRLPPAQVPGPTAPVGVGPAATPPSAVSSSRTTETITVTDRPIALQLFGSYDRANVLAQATREDLPEQVYLRQETRRGRPWFVLIHSLHPSKEEARIALNQLPQTLRSPTPWVRTLSAGTSLDVIRPEHFH